MVMTRRWVIKLIIFCNITSVRIYLLCHAHTWSQGLTEDIQIHVFTRIKKLILNHA